MLVVGIDEVGRGSIAGPLVVGAVALEEPIDGVKDSKLLSRSLRTSLDAKIRVSSLYCSLGWVSAAEIDCIGLSLSLTLAAERALADLHDRVAKIIIDGNYNFLPMRANVKTVVGADRTVACVSAASIVAKVARDQYMIDLDAALPEYGFDRHVGYCTQRHLEAVLRSGISSEHRITFAPFNIAHD